ncbi:MAG: hypothetical protein K0Q69_3949 [Devosia sp.]|jgi:hypothetical protein|nr:hypothetical protein [Devosia sp.]
MKGEVPHREFGTNEDRASTLHLPLYGGGREGGVSISQVASSTVTSTFAQRIGISCSCLFYAQIVGMWIPIEQNPLLPKFQPRT